MSFAKLRTLNDPSLLVPGESAKSLITTKVSDGEIPEDGELSDAEKSAIKEWIDLGAPGIALADEPYVRQIVTLEDTERWVRDDLLPLPLDRRRFMRYVSLGTPANDAGISDDEIISFKVAISQLASSLSSMPTITRPAEIGNARLIFRLDLRNCGCLQSQWSELESSYPVACV